MCMQDVHHEHSAIIEHVEELQGEELLSLPAKVQDERKYAARKEQ